MTSLVSFLRQPRVRELLACATVAASALLAPTAASAEAASDGYRKAGFDVLASFAFTLPEPAPDAPADAPPPSGAHQIPAEVKALDGQKVIVSGYMMPVKMEKGQATEFLLVSNPALCCYGTTPQMNEFIVVRMTKGGVTPVMDVPVEFYGKLRVGEVFEENYLSQIYTLEGEKMGKSAVE